MEAYMQLYNMYWSLVLANVEFYSLVVIPVMTRFY